MLTDKRMRHYIPALLLLAALGLSRSAFAQTSPADARDAKVHFDVGTRHFNIQEYADSIKEYKAAYKLDARPEYLWALAQTQRLSGDCEGAIRSYQSFVRSGATPQQATAANELIEKCKAAVSDPKGPAAPDAKADAKVAAEALAAEVAKIKLEAAAKAKVEAEAKVKADAEAKAKAEAAARRWYKDPGGHVLFFGGAAALVAGGVLVAVGNGQISDANVAADSHAFATLRDGSGTTLQRVGVAGIAVGGALAAAGIVRFVVVGQRKDGPAAVSVGMFGLGAGVSGHF